MAYVIEQDICSGCHTCELYCPVEAISMNFSKYWIDPGKCVSCGTCAAHCHNNAIYDPDAKPVETPKHGKLVMECDVLVIGGGASGLVAGAKAACDGKKVIVLEKNKETGGSAYFGHMMRIHWSKWHEAAGIPDKREKLYATFLRKTQGRCNNELARRLLDANVDLANWLIDSGNMEKGFKWGVDRSGNPDIEPDYLKNYPYEIDALRSDPSCGPGESGWAICNILTDAILEKGGEILLKTPAVKLLTDDTGAVAGALAKDPGGELEIRAKAVIVAAGSYSRNPEIMAKMQPSFAGEPGDEPIHIYACSTCTGDGITMCEEIGAHIDYVNKRAAMFGPMHHPFSYGVLSLLRGGGSEVQVNKYGEKAPDMTGMHEIGDIANMPGRIAWSITDQKSIDQAVEKGLRSTDPDEQRAFRHWERDLAHELRDGSTVKADTLEELADKMGFRKETFLQVIADYNQQVRSGKMATPFGPPPGGDPEDSPMGPPPGMGGDDDGGMMMPMMEMTPPHALEEGPFYAVIMKGFQENAVGGMTIDENCNVCKPDGTPIPGLYACGDNTRGIMLPGDIGVQYIEMYLSAMTYAMCSGYLAVNKAMEAMVQSK